MGNEFFARDLLEVDDGVINSVPPMFGNPKGLISFSSGAFRGYDSFGKLDLIGDEFFIPRSSGADAVSVEGTPQNHPELYRAETVYERLGAMEGLRDYYEKAGGDATVVVHSHYGRGADRWLTWDLEVAFGESELLEQMSWDKMNDYLEYFEAEDGIRFPALTVWYLPGLDHQAHKEGMGAYRDFLIERTDGHIADVVGSLRELDEFDNKLFIIVSDHGMTGMPVFNEITLYQGTPDERKVKPYDGCKLVTEEFGTRKVQDAEKHNNNLHIWELAEGLRIIGKHVGLNYKLLVPKEIAEIYGKRDEDLQFRPTADIHEANVIAALNGPMAHIYLRGGDGWQDQPSGDDILLLALMFRRLFQEDGQMLPIQVKDEVKRVFPKLLSSVDKILVRTAGGEYRVYEGYGVSPSSISAMGSGYIEAETRISGLNNLERSGDIILLMKDKTEGVEADRYTCGVACKAWHGSLNASDSYVPFILTYPGGNSEELNKFVGCETCPSYGGNWKVSDMILKIISEQYK